MPNTAGNVANKMLSRFVEQGGAQGKRNYFGFAGNADDGVSVLRANGKKYDVKREFIVQAVEAVRKDPAIYNAGPTRLKPYINRWIYSPLWAMLHLMTLDEICS